MLSCESGLGGGTDADKILEQKLSGKVIEGKVGRTERAGTCDLILWLVIFAAAAGSPKESAAHTVAMERERASGKRS